MRTALDTNVISELLEGQTRAGAVTHHLRQLQGQGPLLICGVVYSELHARRNATRALLDTFLDRTGIDIDSGSTLEIWAEAGRANTDFHARRRATGVSGARSVLPDLLIGAHAQLQADRLFTLNPRDFSDFPALKIVTLEP
ncbi:type II toxin-antitoxin system VapC family toxin [Deinococcus altitudinis]|uniref:type II toxin-antitoxin system VapC family toxin n=1 Tax=Deinococcus altitudinis TaxID=468914 RepID=UPI003891D501